ncbi:MAG TPA: hypothetical protein VF299_02485 [Mycobacterium sp.]
MNAANGFMQMFGSMLERVAPGAGSMIPSDITSLAPGQAAALPGQAPAVPGSPAVPGPAPAVPGAPVAPGQSVA